MLDRFVAYNARHNGADIAFGSMARQQSYAQLEAIVSRLARALEGLRDLAPRRVAVQCADTWRHWALTLALGRLGLASASLLNGDVSEEDLTLLHPEIIIIHGTGGLPAGEGRLILDEAWFERVLEGVEEDDASNYYPPVPVEPSAPCRAALVSGTDRNTHLLELSFTELEAELHRFIYHDMVEFFLRKGRDTQLVGNKPHLLCSIGPQSLSGFLMAGAALAAGTTVHSSDAQNIATEMMQASEILLVLTPAHLGYVLKALPPTTQLMSHIHLRVVGAGLSQQLLEQTRERFTPHVQIVYGTDETGIVTAISAEKRQNEESVGMPLPWVEVEVVDAKGQRCPIGEVGHIRIRSGSVRGYRDGRPTSGARFHEGWFYPGDRGAISTTGEVHLHGRADALINVGGAKFDLGVVEEILLTEPRIKEAGVFMLEDRQGVERCYAAIVSTETFDEQALSVKLRQRYAALPPVTMIWVPEIPRTTEGHVERERLRAMLKDYIQHKLER
ncbi:class I adenylate-forming enzyme family protein [Bombella saccharophila]|uniref:Acyl--CoA ligase n=1 Tax=Bombella saccharophila TaxID=2967338 RepID=A0ABT3W6B9_9PROT|nr:class I adenylate-forming enzyme family protein [Bombella saccharophila]MCX5614615.1 acyl--CoA ligase [Bombella saccharophila]